MISRETGCTRCHLADYRRNQVIGRGSVPADILIVGEAPGKSEDLLGIPFVGRSGRLLDHAIIKAASFAKISKRDIPSYYITNVVQCRPTDVKGGPNRPPTPEEAWSCWVNLERVYKQVKPKRVVLLGKVAEQHCKKLFPGALVLPHPAFILRVGGISSPEFRRFAISLSEVFREVYHE